MNAKNAELRQRYDLDGGEALLLWAVRNWVHGPQRGDPSRSIVARAWCELDAPALVEPFDMMMNALQSTAGRPIMIRCEICRWVSSDEERVLGSIAMHQTGLEGEAAHLLAPLIRPGEVSRVTPHFRLAGWAFSAAGLRLPRGGAFRQLLALAASQSQHEGADAATVH